MFKYFVVTKTNLDQLPNCQQAFFFFFQIYAQFLKHEETKRIKNYNSKSNIFPSNWIKIKNQELLKLYE